MTMKSMSKRAGIFLRIATGVLLVIIPFLALFAVGVLLPEQYSQTYYAQLPAMVQRLTETDGKKIVIIGNSAIPFGVDSALCEQLLQDSGEDYAVCNFGLYGLLGTKMMLDLSKDALQAGDIVIFAPELTEHTLSLYFSAQEAWYALEGNMQLFWRFPAAERGSLLGAFPSFAAEKLRRYRTGEPGAPSGVYARESFDAHGDLTTADREYNTMPDGIDENNLIALTPALFDDDFIAYVNDYAADLRKRGIQMYYAFPPMNEDALISSDAESRCAFYDFIRDSFDFPIMSDIDSCIMEKEFFFDSNFHLNAAGMIHYTVNLVENIKNQLGNTRKTEIILPEKPIKPDASIVGEGDNTCADCFTYIKDGNYYIIDGLTEKGKASTSLTVPYQVNGLYVKRFLPEVFAGNTKLVEITIQGNITSIPNGSFKGCTTLKKVILTHEKPSDISVGYRLLDGTNAKIYIQNAYVNTFTNDYSWGYYEQKIVGY